MFESFATPHLWKLRRPPKFDLVLSQGPSEYDRMFFKTMNVTWTKFRGSRGSFRRFSASWEHGVPICKYLQVNFDRI